MSGYLNDTMWRYIPFYLKTKVRVHETVARSVFTYAVEAKLEKRRTRRIPQKIYIY